ncbi:hypothetical protein ccbrp13_16570 [Ktedonobacteria bacterium brp13]|nr:hypothetical protein ccbrp13_16570 [Ktedonobacteria bacterium brp13]
MSQARGFTPQPDNPREIYLVGRWRYMFRVIVFDAADIAHILYQLIFNIDGRLHLNVRD